MSVHENIYLVHKLFEIYNRNDLNGLDDFNKILAPNVQLHDPAFPEVKPNIQSIKQLESSYIKAFPNKKIKIDSILTAENQVVICWTATGTQEGEFMDIPPTNRDFTITGISIYHIANGKIAEIRQNWDRLGLIEQTSYFSAF